MNSDSLRYRIACRLVPELKLARGYDEQEEVYSHVKPLRVMWMLVATMGLFGVAMWNSSLALQTGSFNSTIVFIWLIPCAILFFLPDTLRKMRFRARQFLQLRGASICTRCGYDLRGLAPALLASSSCPECGESIDPASPAGVGCIAVKASSMRFRFARRFVPELRLARTDFERGLICHNSKLDVIVYFACFLLFIAAGMLFQRTSSASGGLPPAPLGPSWLPVLLPAIPLVILAIAVPVCIRRARQAARGILIERGIPLCFKCGRDLRDGGPDPAPQPRCPACAEATPARSES